MTDRTRQGWRRQHQVARDWERPSGGTDVSGDADPPDHHRRVTAPPASVPPTPAGTPRPWGRHRPEMHSRQGPAWRWGGRQEPPRAASSPGRVERGQGQGRAAGRGGPLSCPEQGHLPAPAVTVTHVTRALLWPWSPQSQDRLGLADRDNSAPFRAPASLRVCRARGLQRETRWAEVETGVQRREGSHPTEPPGRAPPHSPLPLSSGLPLASPPSSNEVSAEAQESGRPATQTHGACPEPAGRQALPSLGPSYRPEGLAPPGCSDGSLVGRPADALGPEGIRGASVQCGGPTRPEAWPSATGTSPGTSHPPSTTGPAHCPCLCVCASPPLGALRSRDRVPTVSPAPSRAQAHSRCSLRAGCGTGERVNE